TLSHDVMELAYIFLNDAVRVEVKPEQVTAEGVEHILYHVGLEEKIPALLGLLEREGAERTLIFCNMKRTADRICRTLEANGYPAEQITGDIDQRKRLRILEEFREGRLPILVATDVASRGLHIEGVTHVINYDLPFDPEDYVHRVGRTARAGAQGKAISLACENYVESLEGIEQLIGSWLPREFPDESLLKMHKRPAPAPRRSAEGGRRDRGRRSERSEGRRGGGTGGERRDRRPHAERSDERGAERSAELGAEGSAASGTEGTAEGWSDAAPSRGRGRKRRRRSGGASGGASADAANATEETGASGETPLAAGEGGSRETGDNPAATGAP